MASSPWSPHLRGHLLRFDRPPAPGISASDGARLLVAAVLAELLRVVTVAWLQPRVPLLLLAPAMLLTALLLLRAARVEPARIGLRPWREWSTTEHSFLLQALVLANVVFPLVLAGPIAARLAEPAAARGLLAVFLPYLVYGFYQELVYRGMVQRALVTRWGAAAGIVAANLLFTLGPLHWRHIASPGGPDLAMLAAIFGIGLYFGLACHRSGNLWIVAILHAVGNAYLVWSLGAMR